MAAPSGITWGSIVGGYGRIGIYVTQNATNTTARYNVEVWFWSKYSVSDSNNTLYLDGGTSSIASDVFSKTSTSSINTTGDAGSGWSTSNQVKLYSHLFSRTRGETSSNVYLFAKLSNVDRIGGNMVCSVTLTVPALPTYTVSYYANGGTGAPSAQSKFHGVALTLSNTKPTRAGYAFSGWRRSETVTTFPEFLPGGTYTEDAALNLTAIWSANQYTVAYNANGGTGAPSAQTKTHGTTLYISSTKPTRRGYAFKGWGTSKSATTVAYSPGGSYTQNAAITLYAIWELDYRKPIIYNLTASRCNTDGTANGEGTCALVHFNWECYFDVSGITAAWSSSEAGSGSQTVTASGKSGTVDAVIGNSGLISDLTYSITVTVADSDGDTTVSITLPGSIFPIDLLEGGRGIAFGKNAELENTAEFAFDAKFNNPVYGKALGMDRLPAIPANSDFNDYMQTGCYAVQSNAISETCANIPVKRAGRLEVWASTGEGVRLQQWSYLRQRFIPYNSPNAVYERELTRGEDNVWTYYDWWRSSLTPKAAEKVYSKSAITIALGSNTTLGVVNAYTKLPLGTLVASTGNRLTLDNNSIKVGSNIEFVKVSGQAIVKFGSTNGNRHVRIQKESNGTTSSVAWACVYGVASSNTPYALPPIIVPVKEGDHLKMVFYTSDSADQNSSGSADNGWQTYLTAEEI